VTMTESPVTMTESPVTMTESPVTMTESPVTTTESPVKMTESPATAAPVMVPTALPSSTAPTAGCKNWTFDERKTGFVLMLMKVVDPTSWTLLNSSQIKALNWLVYDDRRHICPDNHNLVQRYVLAVIYFATNGDGWFTCTWNQSTPCDGQPFLSAVSECDWGGIECDTTNHVAKISLQSNNLKGPIPPEIGLLENLYDLTMEENELTGTLPESIVKLAALKFLDLDHNKLVGTIPEGLYDLQYIWALDLDSNHLTGTISTRIGQLEDLYIAQFDGNNMTGSIPSEIGALTNLGYLTLSGNAFNGAGIPQEVCDNQAKVYAGCDNCKIENCCADCL